MKAHIYCRISTENQNKSNIRQVNKCIEFCKKNNIQIEYIYEESSSSRKFKNKNTLNDVIKKMKTGDILIIPSIDRFSRNVYGGLEILEKMVELGLHIFSIDDNIGYFDIYDKHKFRERMSYAELESDIISKRVKGTKKIINITVDNNKNDYINNINDAEIIDNKSKNMKDMEIEMTNHKNIQMNNDYNDEYDSDYFPSESYSDD